VSELMKLHKATFQHVESELGCYHDTRKEIIVLRNEILRGGGRGDDENVGGGRGNLPGDPTGRKAVLLTSHKKLEQLQAIVDAIESIVERLPEEKQRLIHLKYWSRTQRLTWEGIGMEINVSARQAMRWRDEIIAAIAHKIGWR
jgi:phage transcriptional activator, RinA family